MENERRDPDNLVTPNGLDGDRPWVADQGLELHRLITRRRTNRASRGRKGETDSNESRRQND